MKVNYRIPIFCCYRCLGRLNQLDLQRSNKLVSETSKMCSNYTFKSLWWTFYHRDHSITYSIIPYYMSICYIYRVLTTQIFISWLFLYHILIHYQGLNRHKDLTDCRYSRPFLRFICRSPSTQQRQTHSSIIIQIRVETNMFIASSNKFHLRRLHRVVKQIDLEKEKSVGVGGVFYPANYTSKYVLPRFVDLYKYSICFFTREVFSDVFDLILNSYKHHPVLS